MGTLTRAGRYGGGVRAGVVLAAAAAAALSALAPTAHADPVVGSGKVAVLGFDGADPSLVRKYMEEGRMPNLQKLGREGIVSPGPEYDALLAELKAAMPRMVDPETGELPVHAVYTRDELYGGYDPDLTPDLRVTNPPGYRVSWQTSLGGAPEALVEANLKAWSGDHCSMDPSFIPGMFFSNIPFEGNPDMLDMAPTILSLLGLPPRQDHEGKPLRPSRGGR